MNGDTRDEVVRDSAHVLEERSRRAFKSVLPAEWIVHDIREDYGADFHVEIFESSRATGFEFAVQLKAHEGAAPNRQPSLELRLATVEYLLRRALPAMVVLYVAETETLYYRWLEECLTEREYAGRRRARTTITIAFGEEMTLSKRSAGEILDYFRQAGASEEQVKALLSRLPQAGAWERYRILQEIRFLRSPDGVLYLLSMLPLDALMSTGGKDKVFSLAADTLLEVCLSRPTPASTMLFWGVAADIARREEHSYRPIGERLFRTMLPRFLRFDTGALAEQSYRLFGYSTESGLRRVADQIGSRDCSRLVSAVCRELHPIRKDEAHIPQAPDLYASLYTVELVDGYIAHLTDAELRALCGALESLRTSAKKGDLDRDEVVARLVEGVSALTRVFGLEPGLEAADKSGEMQSLSESMAGRKVGIFMKHMALKECLASEDRRRWDETRVLKHLVSDMLTYQRVFWYGRALDWFGLSCFCRSCFHGGR